MWWSFPAIRYTHSLSEKRYTALNSLGERGPGQINKRVGRHRNTMRIERKQIRNLDRYLNVLPPNSTFKIISEVDDQLLARMGFELPAIPGATALPAVVGRVTRFNAEGKWHVRRDLPKELRFVGSRSWTRQEWRGRDQTEEVEDTIYIYRWAYPRDLIEPPSVELTYVEHEGNRLVVSPELTFQTADADLNKHVINLMLELFRSCEIVLNDLARLTPPAELRANWVMLPPGEHPWERIEAHIGAVFAGKTPSVAKAVLERQRVILAHEPAVTWRGLGGFSDYIAYIFPNLGLVVLESIYYGNALYVLGENWEDLSKLTKAQIIQHQLAERRIVHSKGWIQHLNDALLPKS